MPCGAANHGYALKRHLVVAGAAPRGPIAGAATHFGGILGPNLGGIEDLHGVERPSWRLGAS